MQFAPDQVQRNAGQAPQNNEAMTILMHLLHKDVGGVVLTTSQLAKVIGKTEAALRLAESRHRSMYGCDLLPLPLFQNAAGRVWSVAQIAIWLVQGGLEREGRSVAQANGQPTSRRGRPRKLSTTGSGLGG